MEETNEKILGHPAQQNVQYCMRKNFSLKQILKAKECPLKKRIMLAGGVFWKNLCEKKATRRVFIILAILYLLAEFGLQLLVGLFLLVGVLLSLIWYPILMWRDPMKAKRLLKERIIEKAEDNDGLWKAIMKEILYLPCKVFQSILSWMWSWLGKLLPQTRWEIDWFDRQGQADKLSILQEGGVRKKTVKRLWERSPEDRKIISKSRVLHMKSLRELFYSDSEEDYNTLRDYVVSTKSSDLPKDLEPFLVSKITENGDDESIIHRAYGVLSSLEKLSSPTLVALVGMIESPKAVELLNSYWKDKGKTFSQEIVDLIVEKIDTKEGYNLFFKIASRDALSSKTVDRFLDICEENGFTDKKEAFLSMRKRRADCYEQSYTASGCHETLVNDKAQWQQYLAMVDSVVPAAQAEMTEWQYDLFHERGFLLDEKVVYTMLIERSLHNKYFRKVLSEAIGRGIFSDRARMHVMDSDWKRDILYELEHASKDQPF